MEYKKLKECTLFGLIQDGANMGMIKAFESDLMYDTIHVDGVFGGIRTDEDFKYFIVWAKNHDYIEWLEEHGYIEEIDLSVAEMGDCFYIGEEYIVMVASSALGEYVLIRICGCDVGGRWPFDGEVVESPITKEVFAIMLGNAGDRVDEILATRCRIDEISFECVGDKDE